ncbi:MAG TPA: hypothetical protein VEJ63_05995 [Planctomycetota bacterium]|nr:hypothetical protein [Planctomycetota bacterium]
MALNHILVAELLVEDAKLREVEEKLRAALHDGDENLVGELQVQILKRNNMRKLILGEMSERELELYKLQREHP